MEKARKILWGFLLDFAGTKHLLSEKPQRGQKAKLHNPCASKDSMEETNSIQE